MIERPIIMWMCYTVLAILSPFAALSCWAQDAAPTPIVVDIGHRDEVTQIAFSPDSKVLASASKDKTIVLRDVGTGAWRGTLRGHKSAVHTLAFARDGVKLAAGDAENNIIIWNVQSGQSILTLRENASSEAEKKAGVVRVVFSADGKLLASTHGGGILRIWDAVSGAGVVKIQSGLERSSILAFSTDGQIIYSGGEGEELLSWDVRSGRAGAPLQLAEGVGSALAISPDAKLLASRTATGPVAISEVATGKTVTTFQPPRALSTLAFSPDATQLLGVLNMNLLVAWNANKGEILQAIEAGADMYAGDIVSLAISPNGKSLAAASSKGTVKLWDAKTGKLVARHAAHRSEVIELLAGKLPDPSSAILASYSDGAVRVWDGVSGNLSKTLAAPGRKVSAFALAPSGKTLAVCLGYQSFTHTMATQGVPYQEIQLWDTQTWTLLRKIQVIGHQNGVTSLAFSPDETTLAGGTDAIGFDEIRLWDVKTGEVKTYLGQSQRLRPRVVQFSPDGKLIASSSEAISGIQIWRLSEPTPFFKQDYSSGDNTGRSVVFLSNDQVATTGGRGIRVYSIGEKKWRTGIEKVSEPAHQLFKSPDGKLLGSVTRTGKMKLWSLPSLAFKDYLKAEDTGTTDAAFLPNSRTIATAHNDGSIKLWSSESGNLIATLLTLPSLKSGEAEGEWIAWTSAGYFDGSSDAAKYVRQSGSNGMGTANTERDFRRPAEVRKALAQ